MVKWCVFFILMFLNRSYPHAFMYFITYTTPQMLLQIVQSKKIILFLHVDINCEHNEKKQNSLVENKKDPDSKQ